MVSAQIYSHALVPSSYPLRRLHHSSPRFDRYSQHSYIIRLPVLAKAIGSCSLHNHPTKVNFPSSPKHFCQTYYWQPTLHSYIQNCDSADNFASNLRKYTVTPRSVVRNINFQIYRAEAIDHDYHFRKLLVLLKFIRTK